MPRGQAAERMINSIEYIKFEPIRTFSAPSTVLFNFPLLDLYLEKLDMHSHISGTGWHLR